MDKGGELFGGDSVINGATPFSLMPELQNRGLAEVICSRSFLLVHIRRENITIFDLNVELDEKGLSVSLLSS